MAGNPRSAGLKAHQARARRNALIQAQGRRISESLWGRQRATADRAYRALEEAQKPARRIARVAWKSRRRDLAAAIDRLERAGVVTALSSIEQQRRGTIPGGPRARRLTALQRAYERRTRVNPRRKKRSTMAKAKRNRLGRFVKSAQRHVRRARNRLGHFISASKPKRRKATKKRTAPRRRKNPAMRVLTLVPAGGHMPRALVANPKRRRAKRRRGARRSASGRFLKGSTTRRRRRRTTSNPRRRHRRSYRRNPGMPSGLMRSAMASLLPMGLGGIGGAISGFADAKFMADKPIVSAASKVVLGAVSAAFLRKRPALAFGFAGGVMGSFGYSMGVKAAGGLVATSPTAALKGIADMANDDPEMAALLEGLGELTPDTGVGDAGDDYADALADTDDDLSDLVEAD